MPELVIIYIDVTATENLWQKYPFLSKLRTPPKKILATGLNMVWLFLASV